MSFSEDEDIHSNATSHIAPHSEARKPGARQSAFSEVTKTDIGWKVAKLLFLHYPHPINCTELAREYNAYYNKVRAEMNSRQQIEEIAKQNRFVKSSRNHLATRYQTQRPSYYEPLGAVHMFQLTDVYDFLHDESSSYETVLVLILEKINKHMNAFHPEGIFGDQLNDLFRHWIGVEFDKLDRKFQSDIRHCVFETASDPQINTDQPFLIIKGSKKPQSVLKEPWKAYALGLKYQIICSLNYNQLTRHEFLQEYQRLFGHSFNLNSSFSQNWLEQLLDPILFQKEDKFVLDKETKKTQRRWLEWWEGQGPKRCNYIHADPVPRSDEDWKRSFLPHDPETCLFLGGIPLEVDDASVLLRAVEEAYDVKFANRSPAIIKTTKRGAWGFISPIPVETREMARKLTEIKVLHLRDWEPIEVRKYDQDWYQRGAKRMDYDSVRRE